MTCKIHNITAEERAEVQACLLHMLKDIDYVCKKHNITYMLCGGTALGAVRHQGFIPWDDDLDLTMPRADYKKFIEVMHDEMVDFYDFSYPNSAHVDYPFLKIFKKNTRFVELLDNMEYNSLWVDVFPLDYAPQNIFMRKIKGIISDFIFHVIGASLLLENNSNSATKNIYAGNWKQKLRYGLAMLIGKVLFFMNYKQIFNIFDRYVSSDKASDYMTIPTGRKYYLGECLNKEVIYPVKKILFCDVVAPIHNNVDLYLTAIYGDYMQIPPVDKREKHLVSEFAIDKLNIKWLVN